MAQQFTDGDWESPEREGPPIISFPLQDVGDTRTRMVQQRYTQDARFYTGASLDQVYPYEDLPNPRSLGMVYHLDSEYIGATMIAYTAVWCDVPGTRQDRQTITFNYQYATRDEDGIAQIVEIPLRVNAFVQVSYVRTANPGQILVKDAFRLVRIPGGIANFGVQSMDGKGNILAEPTDISRWKGNIWEIRELYVPNRQLGTGAAYISVGGD